MGQWDNGTVGQRDSEITAYSAGQWDRERHLIFWDSGTVKQELVLQDSGTVGQ